MREIVKLALTLMIIAVICGGILSGVYGVTAPIIAEREAEAFKEALGEFFPDAEDFEIVEVEGEDFTLCYNAQGDLVGIVAEPVTAGYGGDIRYNLAVDAEGNIVGIRIIEHQETAGIGEVITKPEFQDRVIGKNVQDPIAIGVDIDAVSGATVSSRAMVGSIREYMDIIGKEFLGIEVESVEVDISSVPDGTYTGSAIGFSGEDVVVEVTVEGGAITSIEILQQNDTPAIFAKAEEEVPARIIEEQSVDVDVASGASGSSKAIMEAVANALSP